MIIFDQANISRGKAGVEIKEHFSNSSPKVELGRLGIAEAIQSGWETFDMKKPLTIISGLVYMFLTAVIRFVKMVTYLGVL